MNAGDLTGPELEMILTSLGYTLRAFQDYERYPDEAFRKARAHEVDALIAKLRTAQRREPAE